MSNSWFSRLKEGLKRTREAIGGELSRLLRRKEKVDPEVLEMIRRQLLLADVGVHVTEEILKALSEDVAHQRIKDPMEVIPALKKLLSQRLKAEPLNIEPFSKTGKTFVLLVVGVNGVGKTTTIGKMAHYWKSQGLSVALAAGDTFRAAAIEQLKTWGTNHQIPVISQHIGADSASVIFDAVTSAQAKKIDVLIADTAGRLHTQGHLMQELQKILRVIKKLDATAPHEVLLVCDASIGQNALQQAKQFGDAVDVSGMVMTKLDGTAKGGILFAIANEVQIPVRFIGVGERVDDLKPFIAQEFVDALFSEEAL